jgi:hypothetical protein
VHVSVLIAAALAAGTAVVVLRYLPAIVRHQDVQPVLLDDHDLVDELDLAG